MLTEQIKQELVDRIKSAGNVDKILLFGSQATGVSGAESDIDLLVILDSDTVPSNFRQRSANYLQVSRAIRDIEKNIPSTCSFTPAQSLNP